MMPQSQTQRLAGRNSTALHTLIGGADATFSNHWIVTWLTGVPCCFAPVITTAILCGVGPRVPPRKVPTAMIVINAAQHAGTRYQVHLADEQPSRSVVGVILLTSIDGDLIHSVRIQAAMRWHP